MDEHEKKLAATINAHIGGIRLLFGAECAITVLVRFPDHPDGGLLVTEEPIKTVMAELYRISDRPPIYNIGSSDAARK